MKYAILFLSLLVGALIAAGCGSDNCSNKSNSATNCKTTGSTVTINLHPDTTTVVTLGATLQITADVSGSSNTALTWEVNGTRGGNSTVGTITQDGLYMPPATVPAPNTVTVTAISEANTSDEASISVVIVSDISLSLSPGSVDVIVAKQQQFTVSVRGNSNTNVAWQVAGISGGSPTVGTISAQGLYTAPNALNSAPISVAVTATAAVDATKTASASVTLHNNIGVSLTPASTSVQTFAQQLFTATVASDQSATFSWAVNGIAGGNSSVGRIVDVVDSGGQHRGLYTAPNHVPTVSAGSASNLANGGSKTTTSTVTAIYQGDSYFSASSTVAITSANQKSQSLPTLLGVSGGNGNDSGSGACCGGTLGAVISRGGHLYILSNSHVLARSDLGAVGDPILQPGLLDASCSAIQANQVGTLSQFVDLESPSVAPVDAALALILPGKVDSSGTILQLGSTMKPDGQPADAPPHAGSGVAPTLYEPDGVTPLKVAKSGRSTGLTCSSISAINVTASVTYQKGCGSGTTFQQTYNNLLVVSGGSFSAEGDSGALVVTQDTSDPIGLLFAGSDTDSLSIPVGDVLSEMADPTTGEKPVFVGSASTHGVAGCSLAGAQYSAGSVLSAQQRGPSSEDLESAAQTRDNNASSLLAHPEVSAVGVGASLDNPTEPAIILFVKTGTTGRALPQQVQGVRTRIVEKTDGLSPQRVLSAEESQSLVDGGGPRALRSLSHEEMARVRLAHGKAADELMLLPGIQGVGVTSSADSPGEAALVVYLVRGMTHDPVPPLINGVRTVVRESERFRSGFGRASRQDSCRYSPRAAAPHRANR